MSFAMLKTWIMVNVYSFMSSFITYIANVMIFFDCKQLCRCTFLLFNILDLLAKYIFLEYVYVSSMKYNSSTVSV